MKAIYEFVPLDTGTSTNIRLVEILDASHNESDRISCKLHVVPLSPKNPVSYTALSYMWGSPYSTETILLNGVPFRARENLVDFLYQARPLKLGFLWIDALCIDQSSVMERNHQVSIMKHIYSSAEKAIVWLGLVPLGMQFDFDNLPKSASDVITRNWPHYGAAIDYICQHRYWKRIWIVQEYVLAKKIDIMCGRVTLDGEYLAWIIVSVSRLLNPLTWTLLNLMPVEVDIYRSRATRVVLLREERLAHGLTSRLDDLLGQFWYFQCADVRDRIYALLSLVSTDMLEQLEIVPDYSKSAVEIFQDVHQAFLRCHIYQRLSKSHARRLVLRLSYTVRLQMNHINRQTLDKALEESDVTRYQKNGDTGRGTLGSVC